jgi:hypothetical protein
MPATKEVTLMKLEETRVSSMLWRRRLENKGMIEISQDRKTKAFVGSGYCLTFRKECGRGEARRRMCWKSQNDY